MSFNRGKFNRYVLFYVPTDAVSASGSKSTTDTLTFYSYASKEEMSGNTDETSGKRRSTNHSTWCFPYNEAIVIDGYFVEQNKPNDKYYVVDIKETIYQTETEVKAVLRR